MGYDMGIVLGDLMKSIVAARSSSDQASRDLALQYERDELLRMFPIPFVELEDIEIDLKFAFEAQTEVGPLPYIESLETPESNLVGMTAQRVRDKVIEALNTTLRSLVTFTVLYDGEKVGRCIEETVSSMIASPTRLVVTTIPPEGVSLESFDVREVVNKLVGALVQNGYVTVAKENLLVVLDELDRVVQPISVEHEQMAVASRAQQMQIMAGEPSPDGDFPDPSPYPGPIYEDTGVDPLPVDPVPIPDPAPRPRPLPVPVEFNPMNILIQANELLNLPSDCLSSIKIKVQVKNYEWSSVDRNEGVSRKLIRE
ncbi:hypothetical protein JJB07_23675 [Tumebacillus sp. ITR2]|uniref:Uncharacterized protein n=1 Tax=Tumebacillus amylolyticus TaxID=2801339 RepID=A0ABS1JHB8_9BACL|nr:hypothetical protein [Tumebacillus amylolyticus]MBL0389509.1 hypothetical protein [Tumebacillus amylolyticus]